MRVHGYLDDAAGADVGGGGAVESLDVDALSENN